MPGRFDLEMEGEGNEPLNRPTPQRGAASLGAQVLGIPEGLAFH